MMTPQAAAAAARIAAQNEFGPAADLSDPTVTAWMSAYAENFLEGARRVREGMDEIMREPNAWQNRALVYAAFLDAGAEAATVIAILRAMRGAPMETGHAA